MSQVSDRIEAASKEWWNTPRGLTLNRTQLDWRAAMQSTEIWKSIPGYEGLYEVSDQGGVRSLRGWRNLPTPYVLAQHITTKGYRKVGLCKDGKPRVWFVHMLVLLAFSGPRGEGLQTRHMDGNPENNTLGNLRYGTAKQNIQDQLVHGTHSTASNTHCPSNHPYAGENLYVSPRGERRCRKCAHRHEAKRLAPTACAECGAMVSKANMDSHVATERCRRARLSAEARSTNTEGDS